MWLSQLCEEFQTTPLQMLRELEMAPAGLIEQILECRRYVRAKQAYDNAGSLDEKTRRRLMQDPWVKEVKQIDFALVQAHRRARLKRDDG